MITVSLMASLARAADCPTSATTTDVDGELASAEKAFADLDSNAFVGATDHLVLLQLCLAEVASPALAARWHRVIALKLYSQGDEDGAVAAMRAARALEPAYAFTDDLLPPGPLRAVYEAAPVVGESRSVPEPRDGALAFDGTIGRLRPVDRATLVQRLDPAGRSAETSWLLPSAPLMDYRAVPRLRNRLLVGAGVAATGAVASLAGSLAASSAFSTWTPAPGDADPAASEAHLRSLRGAANGLSTGALVLGLVATGGAVGAIAVGER